MLSIVSAKLIRDKSRDKQPVVGTAIRKAIQRLMVKLTADLCADKRNISTTNMQTPPKEISCSGRCLVSTTSHATSKPKTAKMKSLKVQLKKHVLTFISLLAALRRSPLRTGISLSPFDPFIEALEDSDNRFECPADFFAQVLTRNFVGHSGNGQTC